MMKLFRAFAAAVAAFAIAACTTAPAAAQPQSQAQWDGVVRIVAIGDLEGDYEKFTDMLRTAALIDAEGDWIGGRTHLVQLGDIPDRGANSRMVMDHLMRLERQAQRAGGRVHALIGNHEAMNVEGDLRYVHPGEYAAFADRNSPRRRDAYYARVLDHLRANPPEGGLPAFDEAFRAQWDAEHPLGYVEHRINWGPRGAYGRWVAGHDSVVRINDTLFLHAGIGPSFLGADRDAMNRAIRAALEGTPDPAYPDIAANPEGPLWYRGLALNEEAAEQAHLDALLARHGVTRIVVGHTKRAPLVLPRFGGRVIITDIAQPTGHPDPHAFLVIENGAPAAVHRGQRVPLRAGTRDEECGYLAAIAALDPPQSASARLGAECMTPAPASAQ